jgi:hypothetical protein
VLLGQNFQRPTRCGAGVVHQNVDTPECGGRGVYEALGVSGLREVGGDGNDLPTSGLADRRGRRLQQCGTPRAHGYMTAFLGQSERNAFADAGAASGYECGLVL